MGLIRVEQEVNAVNFVNYLNNSIQVFLDQLPFFLKFVAIFWVVHLANRFVFKGRLLLLGILPRHPLGLLGIFCSPFLHGDWPHLIANSLMLMVLGMFVLVSGLTVFYVVTCMIIVLSGLLTWSFAREGLHVGASGLVMGYWGYLLVQGYYRPSVAAVAIVAVCLYYFIGMFANLFPEDKTVSWEGHVFGFIAGVITVFSQTGVMSVFHLNP